MMDSWWIGAAAACAAMASWLYSAPIKRAARLSDAMRGDDEYKTVDDDALHAMLILRLLRVTMAQGSAIPTACEAVGFAAGGRLGMALKQVGRMLQRGVSWSDAWRIAQSDASNYSSIIRSALEPSWTHGDAPGVRLEATLEQMDNDERCAIERNAATLSVKLLLPTGLCFLPSFVAIGVIPAIVSFVM